MALGGGSIIDAAKVVAAAQGDFSRVLASLKGGAALDGATFTPIIAVPSTAGTGSEVTSWATVWDQESGNKYSLANRALYPEVAVIDPAITVGAPRGLTLATGLDALSHALESIWNVNANPVSANFAVAAAREILDVLPRLVGDLGNLDLRTPAGAGGSHGGPRLLQYENRAGAQYLLRHHAACRYDPRHRVLVFAADGHALVAGA